MNRRHMTGDHHGRTAGRATLLVGAVDRLSARTGRLGPPACRVRRSARPAGGHSGPRERARGCPGSAARGAGRCVVSTRRVLHTFTCEHCGEPVRRYEGEPPRNHCPHCLWSKHVMLDISAFTRTPRRTYSTASARATSPPQGPWFAPLRSDDRRDRGCSSASRTGAVSAALGIEHPGRSTRRTRPRCL